MSDGKAKFKVGDTVRIVKYGHPAWIQKAAYKEMFKAGMTGGKQKPDNIIWESDVAYGVDIQVNLVGTLAQVDSVSYSGDQPTYSLKTDKGKMSWFNEEQLKLQE